MESINKTALVTGATSGIGYHLTRLFAKDGYNLVLVARTEADLHRVSDELTNEFGTQEITIIPKDLSIPGAAAEVVGTAKVGTQVAMSTVMPNELVSKMARKYMEEDK